MPALRSGSTPSVVPDQIRFQPPDRDWRTHLSGLGTRRALNVYLADLRENRELRSTESSSRVRNGVVVESPAPVRIDCHYLITAWSPAKEDVGKTIDEHRLLSEVLGVLVNTRPFVPRAVFAPSPLPAGFPGALADAELPIEVAPVDGFAKLAEFWGTMGDTRPWKPAVYLVVTVPIALEEQMAGAMVTTRTTEYRLNGGPGTGEVRNEIGGRVIDAQASPAVLLPGVWVQLETLASSPLQRTVTNGLGRFTFADVEPGEYQLRWRASARAELSPRRIEVPSRTGEYDLTFN